MLHGDATPLGDRPSTATNGEREGYDAARHLRAFVDYRVTLRFHRHEYRTPKYFWQGVLNHFDRVPSYAFPMKEEKPPTATSRANKGHSRQRDPDGPVATYCRQAVKNYGGNAAQLARAIDVTPGAMSQYQDGKAHISAEKLVDLSLASGLSLGRLSSIAAAIAGRPLPNIGAIEGRIMVLPTQLRASVITLLEAQEKVVSELPPGTWGTPVDDQRLEDKGWRAPDHGAKGGKGDEDRGDFV